jgi:hypothetical protein
MPNRGALRMRGTLSVCVCVCGCVFGLDDACGGYDNNVDGADDDNHKSTSGGVSVCTTGRGRVAGSSSPSAQS